MKDSYTLDATWEDLDKGYQKHYDAYKAIFDRCGLNYFIVGAHSGAMGGSKSEEFMVKSDAGEDNIAYCEKCGYAANLEVAASVKKPLDRKDEMKEVFEISTPNVKSIDELCEFLRIDETECAKSRIYIKDGEAILVLMVGNDEVNEAKLENVLGGQVRPAHPEELADISGADAGSIGPIGFKGKIIADLNLENRNNMYSGANKNDYHVGGIDFKRDVTDAEYFDLRFVKTGEGCTNCSETLEVFKAIELGHIFKLGTKYSEALGANFLDENGKDHPIIMGSYGIGVERVFACYIEQNYDERGIIWGKKLAPFQIQILGLNMKKDAVVDASEKIYNDLTAKGYDVLFDDRTDASAGFKFNDADLMGMPVQIIIGERNLKENKVEVKIRRDGERFQVNLDELYSKVDEIIESIE
jgi:prolyl-tRNA synthetase